MHSYLAQTLYPFAVGRSSKFGCRGLGCRVSSAVAETTAAPYRRSGHIGESFPLRSVASFLVDDTGSVHLGRSAHRVAVDDPDDDALLAVRERGQIEWLVRGGHVRIRLRPSMVSPAAYGRLNAWLASVQPERVLLSWFAMGEWHYEFLRSPTLTADRITDLVGHHGGAASCNVRRRACALRDFPEKRLDDVLGFCAVGPAWRPPTPAPRTSGPASTPPSCWSARPVPGEPPNGPGRCASWGSARASRTRTRTRTTTCRPSTPSAGPTSCRRPMCGGGSAPRGAHAAAARRRPRRTATGPARVPRRTTPPVRSRGRALPRPDAPVEHPAEPWGSDGRFPGGLGPVDSSLPSYPPRPPWDGP